MSLHEYNERWKTFLATDKCPPILGLAPLSEVDCQLISKLVQDYCHRVSGHNRLNSLFDLIRHYPAVMAVWLARVSGEAYDAGAFWPQFSTLIGIEIPIIRRPEFANVLARACKRAMSNYIAAPETNGHNIVAEFLFQAGLPLCHCQAFARLFRAVERSVGLPDVEASDAIDELRDNMFTRPELAPLPVLKRALQGPAGSFLCRTILRVVMEGEFSAINPRLGSELAKAFENHDRNQIRRSATPPFIRLGEDLCSLEVIAPKQNQGQFVAGGPLWIVDGKRHHIPTFDERSFSLQNQSRVTVELRGLTSGQPLLRTFIINPLERVYPYILFDYDSRKALRETTDSEHTLFLKSGRYWLLHPSGFAVDCSEDRIDWQDNERSLCLIRVCPGSEIKLEDTNGATYLFNADQTPFLDPAGESLLTDEAQHIHFHWTHFPTVWLPLNSDERDETGVWTLRVLSEGQAYAFPLRPDEPEETHGGMTRCRVVGEEALKNLAPGLHEIELTIFQRNRARLSETFLLWVGLEKEISGSEFVLSAMPQNIEPMLCHGFSISSDRIRHEQDQLRQHTLTFRIGNEKTTQFKWSQTGTFLESFERKPGQPIVVTSHRLKETFSAGIGSTRWLRIWHVPQGGAQLLVNGQVIQRIERPFFDLSLSQLSTVFPNGGEIKLRWRELDILIARFFRPLVPCIMELESDENYENLLCKFHDRVDWARPRISELISGRTVAYEGKRFSTSGHSLFPMEGLPVIECANIARDGSLAATLHRIELDIPKVGWPHGIWLIELEFRRNEDSEWQALNDDQGGRLPVIVIQPPASSPTAYRAQCLWWAFGIGSNADALSGNLPSSAGNEHELLDLIGEIGEWLRGGFNDKAWSHFRCVEILFGELAKQAAWLLQNGTVDLSDAILAVAARETGQVSTRSLFIAVPQLLALSANKYSICDNSDALRASLSWSAKVAMFPTVSAAFHELIQNSPMLPEGLPPGFFSFFQHFKNFAATVQQTTATDFQCFDYQRYFSSTIGTVYEAPLAPDWDETDTLTRNHILWSISQLCSRRARNEGGNLTEAGQVFSAANDLKNWLRSRLGHRNLLPSDVWLNPWADIEFENDAFVGSAHRFASMFALAARASAKQWISFADLVNWLSQRHGRGALAKALTTLVCLSPELFGYHLMFWELMIRTCPSD